MRKVNLQRKTANRSYLFCLLASQKKFLKLSTSLVGRGRDASEATADLDRVCFFSLKVGKKWKWTGELYMELSPDRADRLCNITLSEPTDPRPRGLRLSVLYDTDVSLLRLQKFHNLADLYQLLRACAPVQQCAKVSHASESDLQALSTLGAWMSRRTQVRSGCAPTVAGFVTNVFSVHVCSRLSRR